MNFIDGLDGLAGGISSIFFLTIGIIAFSHIKIGLDFSLALSITFIMLGSTSGFLVHNFYPAKIFMGDSGSMFLGYIMSIITILGFKSVMMSSIIIPLFILVVPILDTLFAIIRRIVKNRSLKAVMKADKGHLHHKLLNKGFTQKESVLILYCISASLGMFAIILLESGIWKAVSFLLIVIAVFALGFREVFEELKIDQDNEQNNSDGTEKN